MHASSGKKKRAKRNGTLFHFCEDRHCQGLDLPFAFAFRLRYTSAFALRSSPFAFAFAFAFAFRLPTSIPSRPHRD